MNRPTISDKRAAYRRLHLSGCFLLPNPFDVGTACYLQHMGFKAIASTSAGFAFAQALPDGGPSRDAVLSHLAAMAQATDIPLNADFENGYADDPKGVAESVRRCVEAGVAGLSIEDRTGQAATPLYGMETAVARLRAARGAIDKSGGDTLLTGRSEGFLVGRPDLDETITRLRAYASAGADCLYAPGIGTREQIARVVDALAPKPVNVLIGGPSELTMKDLEGLGVRRVSVGGALARAAWGGFIGAIKKINDTGTFNSFGGLPSHADLNSLFRADLARRNS